jgi:hypothetical protein
VSLPSKDPRGEIYLSNELNPSARKRKILELIEHGPSSGAISVTLHEGGEDEFKHIDPCWTTITRQTGQVEAVIETVERLIANGFARGPDALALPRLNSLDGQDKKFAPTDWYNTVPSFSRNVPSVLVTTDSVEARVTQSVLRRPLLKIETSGGESMQPGAHRHFGGCYTVAPSALSILSQIGKKTSSLVIARRYDLKLWSLQQSESSGWKPLDRLSKLARHS